MAAANQKIQVGIAGNADIFYPYAKVCSQTGRDVHMHRTTEADMGGCVLMVTETGGSQGQRRVLVVMK